MNPTAHYYRVYSEEGDERNPDPNMLSSLQWDVLYFIHIAIVELLEFLMVKEVQVHISYSLDIGRVA